MISDWVSFQNELNPLLLKTLYLFTWFRNEFIPDLIPDWNFTLDWNVVLVSWKGGASFIPDWKTIGRNKQSKLIDQLHKLLLSHSKMFMPVFGLTLIIFSRSQNRVSPAYCWPLSKCCLVSCCDFLIRQTNNLMQVIKHKAQKSLKELVRLKSVKCYWSPLSFQVSRAFQSQGHIFHVHTSWIPFHSGMKLNPESCKQPLKWTVMSWSYYLPWDPLESFPL